MLVGIGHLFHQQSFIDKFVNVVGVFNGSKMLHINGGPKTLGYWQFGKITIFTR
jgi:hypothetical protein